MKHQLLSFCLGLLLACTFMPEASAAGGVVYNNVKGLVPDCADPYVLYHDGLYYLYGTGGDDGIKVYVSDNMATWSEAKGATHGYALHKNDVFGNKWFWAPEVYFLKGEDGRERFYMFYSAEERISVAESDSPFGPFTQPKALQKPLHDAGEIDTHLFIDPKDGKKYLYYVRFTNGNEIWVAEMNDDMHTIKEETLRHCLGARDASAQPWEKVQAAVNEGPFVLYHEGLYYLTYSANDYQSPKYAVGYAISDNPMGPWKRYDGNPILIGNDKLAGTGHHSFITKPSGCNLIVYHAHNTPRAVQPRKMCIDTYEFVPSARAGEPDVLRINGPTTTDQEVCSESVGTQLSMGTNAQVTAWVSGRTVVVKGDDLHLKKLSVLSVDGAKVVERAFTGTAEVKLSQGTYIVEVRNVDEKETYSTKVIIK